MAMMICAICHKSPKYLQMTAVGQRAFCSVKCYCEYEGIDYVDEDYMELNQYDENEVVRFE